MRFEYSEAELLFIRLSRIEGVGPGTFYTILAEFPDLEVFFQDVRDSLQKMGGRVRASTAQNIIENASVAALEDFLDGLDKKGIQAMAINHADYPMYLKEIRLPPPVLYVKGALSNLSDRTIGIVGTRRCTRRGFAVARDVAKGLAENGVAVISGMARGIDTAAHTGALMASGVTVAVLGCGVDIIYPRENDKLYYEILEKGAVISEYVPGVPPLAQNFPARNRIVSGISRGVYVVESGYKGGACITVSYALSQGRDVFAAPGNAGDATSEFTNELCENGSPPVFTARAILDAYGWGRAKTTDNSERNYDLNALEQRIYDLLLSGDLNIEELSENLDIPQNELNVTITLMEMKGVIKRMPGLLYGLND